MTEQFNSSGFEMVDSYEEKSHFQYCKNVDLHCLSIYDTGLDYVCSLAIEHNFRGVVTSLAKIEDFAKLLKNSDVKPIAMLDYPFGDSTFHIRSASIWNAKEAGAKEIEIIAPYHFMAKHNFRKIAQDLQNILTTAKKASISVKYVLDQNNILISPNIITGLCRIINASKISMVSTGSGFFFDDQSSSHADNIIKMRTLKNKTSSAIKSYVKNCDVNDFADYIKAGSDIVGMEWRTAPSIVHEYEQLVENT